MIGQPRAAFALEPLGLQDRLHLGKGFFDIVVDHDVVVFRPVTHLVTGEAHAMADHLVGILTTGMQAPFQVRGRRREDEYRHDVGPGFFT